MATKSELVERAFSGDVESVTRLLDAGADPSEIDPRDGWSALMFAIEGDHPDVVALLIDRGADVNHRTPEGWTVLHHAVDLEADRHQQTATPLDLRFVRMLVTAGASASTPAPGYGTPLAIARRYRYEAAVALLESVEGRG